jgi:hypothetical protein
LKLNSWAYARPRSSRSAGTDTSIAVSSSPPPSGLTLTGVEYTTSSIQSNPSYERTPSPSLSW